ncbi:unnamed protein product [Rotaria magnacalcarata]|uniref:TLC domain-containing protein n=1 Tax=Rotaria magnacalcarata TaxID=392030 RepID=A0A819BN59_9BILA|nr:unnamed protein product [Rotaria magnacalcarata]CAF3800971.1 unnamed protein product [Rotaria magnacalcarata]
MDNVNVNIPIKIPHSTQSLRDNTFRVALSYASWLTMFFLLGWISKLLVPKIRTLKPKEQMFWKLAMARAVCGILTLWAVYLVFIDERLALDHVIVTTDESWTFITFLLGFFIFEELTLIYFDLKFRTFSKELHLHHFFAFNGFFIAAYYNCGHYYAAKAFMLEASTPFSCVCWCLLKLKLENTNVWKINQWILINVFHIRSFLEFLWWYDIYRDWDNIKQNLPLPFLINMLVGLTIVSLWLTPYWTYKKTVQYFHPVDWNAGNSKDKGDDDIDKTS